jgi:methionyl aminopeptidase
MTEKAYGGNTDFGFKEKEVKNHSNVLKIKEAKTKTSSENPDSEEQDLEKLKRAGTIASQAKTFARSFIKPQMPLLEIAEKIESKIKDLGGSPAFPVTLSINEVAAHDTPSHNDERLSSGLLKVDLGVHIDGFCADTALTLDLENSQENALLIKAAESALKKAISLASPETTLAEIGEVIEKEIKSFNREDGEGLEGVKILVPIQNLSGHGIERYELHSGVSIPNYNNSRSVPLQTGVYAIEPFVTTGFGSVRDGKPSGIYELIQAIKPRDSFARQVLQFIEEEYNTLPFCSRWIVKKFGSRSLIALKQLEHSGCLKQFEQLIERNLRKVAQAEHTIILTEKEKIITTL